MRKTIPVVVLAVVGVIVAASVTYYVSHNGLPASPDHSPCGNPNSISSHVYNPSRLNIIRSCITASGVVENVFEEADGDYHVRLALDSKYSNLTNSANDQYQYGDLVVEIICALPITQSDAVSACQNYTNNIQYRASTITSMSRTLCPRHEPLQLGGNPSSLHTHEVLIQIIGERTMPSLLSLNEKRVSRPVFRPG